MKYKCSDCGEIFDNKPDYCDCGNNVFEEIVEESSGVFQKTQSQNSTQNIVEQFVEKKQDSVKTNNLDLKIKPNVDLFSIIFFVVCIFLSIVSIIFIGKDSLNTQNNEPNKAQNIQEVKNIPDINKFWIESNFQQTKVELKKEIVPQKEVFNVIKPKNTHKNITSTAPVKSVKNINKAQTVSKSSQGVKTPTKTTIKPNKTPTTQKTTNLSQTSAKPQQTSVKPQNTNSYDMQELNNYKIALRNKLGHSVNFLEVSGDGNCAISFKIDSSGNLINRKFIIQSDNQTLNQAVYDAIMKNPTFKAPPRGYKNETLIFKVKIYNSSFEINLN